MDLDGEKCYCRVQTEATERAIALVRIIIIVGAVSAKSAIPYQPWHFTDLLEECEGQPGAEHVDHAVLLTTQGRLAEADYKSKQVL